MLLHVKKVLDIEKGTTSPELIHTDDIKNARPWMSKDRPGQMVVLYLKQKDKEEDRKAKMVIIQESWTEFVSRLTALGQVIGFILND